MRWIGTRNLTSLFSVALWTVEVLQLMLWIRDEITSVIILVVLVPVRATIKIVISTIMIMLWLWIPLHHVFWCARHCWSINSGLLRMLLVIDLTVIPWVNLRWRPEDGIRNGPHIHICIVRLILISIHHRSSLILRIHIHLKLIIKFINEITIKKS